MAWTLTQRVKGSVKFSFFRDGSLWYATDDGWEFPIPVDDTANEQGGSPTFPASDKAITYMRWIRKHMDALAAARELQAE